MYPEHHRHTIKLLVCPSVVSQGTEEAKKKKGREKRGGGGVVVVVCVCYIPVNKWANKQTSQQKITYNPMPQSHYEVPEKTSAKTSVVWTRLVSA